MTITKEELEKQVRESLDKQAKEIKESVMDQLLFGVSVMEFSENGELRRIDPNSKEGQEIIKKEMKNENN